MQVFKDGQFIVCKNNTNYPNTLIIGRAYRVIGTRDYHGVEQVMLRLAKDGDMYFEANLFEAVKKES